MFMEYMLVYIAIIESLIVFLHRQENWRRFESWCMFLDAWLYCVLHFRYKWIAKFITMLNRFSTISTSTVITSDYEQNCRRCMKWNFPTWFFSFQLLSTLTIYIHAKALPFNPSRFSDYHSQSSKVLSTISFYFTNGISREQWIAVVGFGVHSHCTPVNQANIEDSRPVVQQAIKNDENISTIALFGSVESILGARNPSNSIAKIEYQLTKSLNRFGKSLD